MPATLTSGVGVVLFVGPPLAVALLEHGLHVTPRLDVLLVAMLRQR